MLNTLLIEPTKSSADRAPAASSSRDRSNGSATGSSFESHMKREPASRRSEARQADSQTKAAAQSPAAKDGADQPEGDQDAAASGTEGTGVSQNPSAEDAGEAGKNTPEAVPPAEELPEGAAPEAGLVQVPVAAEGRMSERAPEMKAEQADVPGAQAAQTAAPAPVQDSGTGQKAVAAPASAAPDSTAKPVRAAADAPAQAAQPVQAEAKASQDTVAAPVAEAVKPQQAVPAAPDQAQAKAAQPATAPEAAQAAVPEETRRQVRRDELQTRTGQTIPAQTDKSATPARTVEAAAAVVRQVAAAPADQASEDPGLEAEVAEDIKSEAPRPRTEQTWRATAIPAQQAVLQQQMQASAMMTSGLVMQSAMADSALDASVSSLLAGELLGGETAGLSQILTEAMISPGTVHRPEVPRMVAQQMAEAVAAKGDRNIEIALSPEELGRVKMRLSATESGVSVMITTERPETSDLMRKHINELAEEFRRMGYEDVSFEFSGESADENGGGDSAGKPGFGGDGESGSAEAPDDLPIQQTLRLGETGLDMRM